MSSLLALIAVSLCPGLARGDGEEIGSHPVMIPPRHGGTGRMFFPAGNVQLLGWITLPEFPGGNVSASDCWGYTSPSGREYAVIAMSKGTGFVEVTDPGVPVVVDFKSGNQSWWRAVKCYSHYAYAVSEGGGGIQVFDLADIDTGVVQLVNTVTNGGTTTATHTLAVDEVSGYLYRAGGGAEGIRIYKLLVHPENPVFVGQSNFGYVHECQVVTWDLAGPYLGKQIAFCYTGSGVRIVDVTDKTSLTTIASFTYPSRGYAHQGWTSADKRYFYLDDEQDDSSFGASRTRVFDIANLAAPIYKGFFSSGAGSIDHNLYVKDDRIYEANYTSGLRVYDNTNPTAPVQVGFFDTDILGDAQNFSSLWSNYPFFASGTIVGSDVERGLFLWREGPPGLTFDFPAGEPTQVSAWGGKIEFSVTEAVPGSLVPGSVRVQYSTGGAFAPIAATHLGGDSYRAFFPAVPCGTTIDYYLTAQTSGNVTWTAPAAGGTQVYRVLAAGGESVASADDMESDLGWTVDLLADLTGFATAVSGNWTRVNPNGNAAQPEDDHSADPASFCWVTGQSPPNSPLGSSDVDTGATSLRSPILDASSLVDPYLSYWRWYSNQTGMDVASDTLTVELSNDGGTTWFLVETIGPTGFATFGGWIHSSLRIADFLPPTSTMRVRFRASDLDSGSIVEAAIDDLSLVDYSCPIPNVTLAAVSPAEGSLDGGNWVTLTGTGFQPGTSVSFGARSALQVNFGDPETLEVRVPPASLSAAGKTGQHGILVDVTVANPGSASLVNAYRYSPRTR